MSKIYLFIKKFKEVISFNIQDVHKVRVQLKIFVTR